MTTDQTDKAIQTAGYFKWVDESKTEVEFVDNCMEIERHRIDQEHRSQIYEKYKDCTDIINFF